MDADDRLAALRGPVSPRSYDARKIAALTQNPGCDRRAVLDAAGIDKAHLASRLGFDPRFGRSPFAIARGNAFEALVKQNGYAALLTLLRAELAAPVTEATVEDLNANPPGESLRARARRSRQRIDHMADDSDARTILDHPILSLDVAGTTAYLEPDAITHRIAGSFYVVEIKSFAAIDGQADPAQVAEATKQAAVYVLALRRLLQELGHDPALAADRYLLVCPRDFANLPFGRLVNLRQQLDAVEFQLGRLRRIEDIVALLSSEASLDLSVSDDGAPSRNSKQLTADVSAVPAAFRPGCLATCEMALYCRDEATAAGRIARYGSALRDMLPGIDSVDTARKLIEGVLPVAEHHVEVVELHRAASALRGRYVSELSAGGAA